MSSLQYIVVLCFVLIVGGGAFYLGTQQADAPATVLEEAGDTETNSANDVESSATIESVQDETSDSISFPSLPVPSLTRVTVYDGVSVSDNTTEVDLSGRGLEGSLKAEVRLLSELRTLDVSGNNFTGLPAEVGQLAKLEVLNLSNNPLTGLPHEIGNLQNLKTLDLRDTQYSAFDVEAIESALPPTVQILK